MSDTHFDDPPAATTRRGLLGIGGATALATFAGVGLWPQPLEAAPVQPWINVTDPPFNALGNHDPFGTPGFDNTTAIQNAFNALPITGGALHFPPGNYRCTGQLSASGKSVAIFGSGRKVSQITWDTATGGFSFLFTSNRQALTVRSMSLLSRAAGGGSALYASWPSSPATMSTADISDIYIAGENAASHYWTRGIQLNNATTARIDRWAIHGRDADSSHLMICGIDLVGHCTPIYITNGDAYSMTYGIRAFGTSEGIHISHCEIVEVTYGIWLEALGMGRPGTAITDCHVNAGTIGIMLNNHGDVSLTGNLIYRLKPGSFVGIYNENGPFTRMQGNKIDDTVTPFQPRLSDERDHYLELTRVRRGEQHSKALLDSGVACERRESHGLRESNAAAADVDQLAAGVQQRMYERD